MDFVTNLGLGIKKSILDVASLLREDWAPGIVCLVLVLALLCTIYIYMRDANQKLQALEWMQKMISVSADHVSFSSAVSSIESKATAEAKTEAQKQVLTAWREYRETLVPHEEGDEVVLRNSARPILFFNIDDLGFGPGFLRILPGLFVSVGLFLTFLGLISALAAMDLRDEKTISTSLNTLLMIASAKFTMSLTGLLCSIIFTVVLRRSSGNLERGIHDLCGIIEKRITFISLEALAVEQLRATREQREHFRMIGLELVAELGRPLREELPNTISKAISESIGPVIEQLGKAGSEGVGTMVNDLSERFTDDVGKALATASERLVYAGDRIASLSDRMDQSSGKVGVEIDGAVNRLSQAVDDLRAAMGATADTTTGAFTQGAEHLLAVMNQTLEGIRDNTGEGARALSAAAGEMRTAAESFRNEIDAAAKKGAETATKEMAEAGSKAASEIGDAGKSIVEEFGRTAQDIADKSKEFAAHAAEQLLSPLDQIAERLDTVQSGLQNAGANMQRLADGVRGGAEAAQQASGTFSASAKELVDAVAPVRGAAEKIEGSIRQLTIATENASNTVSRSSKAIAESAERALETAHEVLGGQDAALQATLKEIQIVLERLKGQGDKLDGIDEKLGQAFDVYTDRVATAVDGLFGHVRDMKNELEPALDTLRAIIEQAEKFSPESRK